MKTPTDFDQKLQEVQHVIDKSFDTSGGEALQQIVNDINNRGPISFLFSKLDDKNFDLIMGLYLSKRKESRESLEKMRKMAK